MNKTSKLRLFLHDKLSIHKWIFVQSQYNLKSGMFRSLEYCEICNVKCIKIRVLGSLRTQIVTEEKFEKELKWKPE